jgi:hypothetical protein
VAVEPLAWSSLLLAVYQYRTVWWWGADAGGGNLNSPAMLGLDGGAVCERCEYIRVCG